MIVGTAIGPSKESEMPKEPFLLIGARSYIDSALTADVGKIIESKRGQFLKLKVFESYHKLEKADYTFETILTSIDKVDYPEWVKTFDAYYRLFFEIKRGGEEIEKLCRIYEDPRIDYKKAWKDGSSHCGTDGETGIKAAIIEETGIGVELLHSTEIDIFAPHSEKPSKDLIVYTLYSHRKITSQSILKGRE